MKASQHIVGAAEARSPLLDFLAGELALSRNQAKRLLDTRNVFVNGRRVWMARHTLQRGDRVEVLAVSRELPAVDRSIILFEDASYVVVNKPPGKLADGVNSLEAELRTLLGIKELAAVHRLDRDTSGCLLYAKSRAALDNAVRLFGDQRVLKVYHAIVAGQMNEGERTISRPIDNRKAVTHLRVLDSNRVATHLSLKIETGRTHQIRKHLLAVGHPVLGDRSYGTRLVLPPALRTIERQMLHARRLEFDSPLSGRIRCEAPLPRDFLACLKRLRLE